MKVRISLAAGMLCLAGCVVSLNEPCRCPQPDRPCRKCAPTVDDDAAIAEIDAARTLIMESNRRDLYVTLARSNRLGSRGQVYLVNETFARLITESGKKTVLRALIHNPCFTCAARKAILANLSKIITESSRKQLLLDIHKHGPCREDLPTDKDLETPETIL